jgi:tetratricopeptide (TPR) repeat protein
MSWKTELDRALHAVFLKAADERDPDWNRLVAIANDYVALRESRPESHFLLGVVEEMRALHPAPAPAPEAAATGGAGEAVAADAPPPPTLAASPDGDAALWRGLGRLDAAARASNVDRVRALSLEPWFEAAVPRAREGRAALRAAGRPLVFAGEEERALDAYARHLAAVPDEGSRRDAEVLVGDVVRKADDLQSDGLAERAVALLDRLAAFSAQAGLDARVGAKVERKVGRAFQLAGRWQDATARYQRALALLPADDRYRSVIHGDLALALLEVRGTLDLLPRADRPRAAEAEQVLTQGGTHGEGESYNAIYTLGVLAYERGEWANAAERFGEADRLMRESKAKARIVHARARFFRGACLLRLGATGEALAEAEHAVTRDATAAALEPEVREPVFDALQAAVPTARIPGRPVARAATAPREAPWRESAAPPPRGPRPMREPERGRGEPWARRGEGDRGPGRDAGRPPRRDGGDPRGPDRRGPPPRREELPPAAAPAPGGASGAAAHLAEAQAALESDPRRALLAVDRAFKSRPGFEEWFGAYRTRLAALLALSERDEALRTYERFRAKLYERGRADRLEALLLDASGPVARLFDEVGLRAEKVDLFEVMPGREREFAAECTALARHYLASGAPGSTAMAVALLREAVSRDGDEARSTYAEAVARARAEGVAVDGPSADEVRERIAGRGNPARIVVVGGDEARRPQVERLQDLGRRVGFEGSWILAGARPYHQTLAEVEESVKRGASTILIHHTATPDLRQGVRRIGEALSIPVREIPYVGAAGVEPEVLSALGRSL